jgi:hypothetical protein
LNILAVFGVFVAFQWDNWRTENPLM